MINGFRLKWADFKTVVAAKSMKVQHIDLGDYYHVLAMDSAFKVNTDILKDGGADQTDFDANYKADSNKPIVQTSALTFGSDTYKPNLVGFDFTAVKTTTTTGEYEIDTAYAIHGGVMECQDWNFSDYIEVDVYDKNNVLGYGAGFVLQVYARKWYVQSGPNRFEDIDVAILPAPGLFFRVKYHSTGIVNDVKVLMNILSYQVL
jgi:hypothetical protein